RTVCALFGTVLGASGVGLDDDFFELGGHSLLAVTLIAGLRGAFGVELGLRTLFEAPTPAALLQAITGGHDGTGDDVGTGDGWHDGGRAGDGVEPGAVTSGTRTSLAEWARGRGPRTACRDGRIPLSYAQSRMWFLNRLDPGSSDYNISLAVRLTGDLKPAALASAVDDLVHRHEVLRTIYPGTDGNPEQRILPAADSTGILRLRTAATEKELAAMVSAGAQQGFDVETEPPLRAALIRLDQDEWVLHLVMHHIASDGASLAPLARDISTAYSARSGAARALQRPLAVQYADFTLWQRAMLDGGGQPGDTDNRPGSEETALDAKLQAWRRTLAGLPAELALPADAPRPDQARQHGAQHSFGIKGATAKALTALAGSHNASLFMALHTSLAGYLNRIGAGDDLVIGSPTAGRNDPAVADLIGFFVNTIPIRLDASNNPTFRELLLRARTSVLDAFDKDDVPFERLVSALNPPRTLGRHPVFQTMLTVENTPRAAVELQGVQAVVEPETSTGEAKFDLSFTFRDRGGDDGLAATLDYNAAMFTPETIRELAQRLERFIDLAVATPDHPVSRLDILPESELAALMSATEGPAGDAPAPETILDAFARTVERQPDDTAVVFGAESLTFAELDTASDLIARRLQAHGVGPEDLVSVYLPRSLATVTAVVGVLKSGGAYTPIDVDYPPERVSAILADAAPAAVLTAPAVAAGLAGPLAETGIGSASVICLDARPEAPQPDTDGSPRTGTAPA
ncbi:MAG: condensation domain-containing protein, partial [Actinomycetales bacterium]